MRRGKITASNLFKFDKKVLPVSDEFVRSQLWDPPVDLSNLPAIKYGKKHEIDALNSASVFLCQMYGEDPLFHKPFQNCGIFISRIYPWFAGSPDGIKPGHYTVEAKCPMMIKDLDPRDPSCIKKLTVAQRKSFCLEKIGDKLQLKKDHAYYVQCQAQMFLCDVPESYFVV